MADQTPTPSNNIVALSWKQPFATAMIFGKIETRTWYTNYRGRVLICASQAAYSNELLKVICGPKLYPKLCSLVAQDVETLGTRGFAIATGELVDCRPMTRRDEARCFVPFDPQLYCHIYENVQRIHPFPWTGAQRWKQVDNLHKKSIITL